MSCVAMGMNSQKGTMNLEANKKCKLINMPFIFFIMVIYAILPQFSVNTCKILCSSSHCQPVCEQATLCSKLELRSF